MSSRSAVEIAAMRNERERRLEVEVVAEQRGEILEVERLDEGAPSVEASNR